MGTDRKLSLCITTFNRFEMCLNSFADIIDDDRIDDIVILDDAGTWDNYQCLSVSIDRLYGRSKINLMQQEQNKGMSLNKRDAISFAKNEWAIIFDDDNRIGRDYLDALFEDDGLFQDPSEIYIPDFAKPNFDYREFGRESITAGNQVYCHIKMFGALINTCNYVVNRDYYLKTYQHNPEMKSTDTAWHAYNHLKSGGSFYVVPGMEYEHRVHDQSGFMQDVHYNMAKAKEIENLIRAL